jgi:hypothetical protein
LRAVAEKIEHQARSGGVTDAGKYVAEIKTEFARAQEALAKLTAG